MSDSLLIGVYTVYAGAFFVMAITIMAFTERTARLGAAAKMPLLAAFALTHGVSDAVDLALRLPDATSSATGGLAAVRIFFLVVSFLLLIAFGASMLIDDKKTLRIVGSVGSVAALGVIAALVAVYAEGITEGSIAAFERAARIWLGLPGGLLAAGGLMVVSRKCAILGLSGCGRGSQTAAAGMLAYAILAGAIATGYPGPHLLLGLPIQVFRMIAAVVLTTGCVMLLRHLDIKHIRKAVGAGE
jgi:hypothetical protein